MIKVLIIVEDDSFWQEQLRRDLEEQPDIEVQAVLADKEEALHFVRQQQVDIVLMDINLSGNQLDGIEATRKIVRQSNNKTKVIMMTLFDEGEIIADSFRQGAINYIKKSNYGHLVSAIRDAYRNQASIHADVADAIRAELRLSVLTPMEREVLALKNKGLNKTQIAEMLVKSVSTIKSQMRSIRDKLK